MHRALDPSSCAEVTRGLWRFPCLSRGNLVIATRWLVTLLAFWVLFHSIDFITVVGAIVRARPLGLSLAGFVVAVQFLILVWRWQIVIRIIGGQPIGIGSLAFLLGQSLLIGQAL